MDRGDLSALKDAISNKQFAQDWALDSTGNWHNFREDDDGDGSWNLDQQRTANKVNEITDVAETIGPSWVTPAYDKAGNMTTIPKPADPTASFTGTYDAWNRLVQITEGATTVARYEYDGAKRRVVKKTYSGGVLDETRCSFFTEPSRWQVVEERVDSSSDAERQFVWGLRYIDDIVQRDRDTTGNGTLDERLYGMQDANWNVTAVADSDGGVDERYSYDAYGTSTALTPVFAWRGNSSFQWERRFAGYLYDSEVQFYQVRNRAYSPQVGWVQRDPLGFYFLSHSASDSIPLDRILRALVRPETNLFEYVLSAPVDFTDPEGVTPIIAVLLLLLSIICVTGANLAIIEIWLRQGTSTPPGWRLALCNGATGCSVAACFALVGTPLLIYLIVQHGINPCARLRTLVCNECTRRCGGFPVLNNDAIFGC